MVKIIAFIIAIACGVSISLFCFDFPVYVIVLASIGFSFCFLFAEIVFFLLTWWITGIGVKKDKQYKLTGYSNAVMRFYSWFCLKLFSVKIVGSGEDLSLLNDGSFMIVSNHKSNIDSLVLDVYLKKKKMIFVSKDSLFKVPFVGKMIRRNGYILLDRDDLLQQARAIRYGEDLLKENDVSIGIFPEGTRYKERAIGEFKAGSFRLATASKRPIAIFSIYNSNHVAERLLYKRHYVYVKFLGVINPEEYSNYNLQDLSKMVREKVVEGYQSLEAENNK